jgi:hypothetical protein
MTVVERTAMRVDDALPLLKATPGLAPLLDRLPSAPAAIDAAAAQVDAQAGVLAALVAAVPVGLRRIPISVEAALQREAFTRRVDGSGPLVEEAFEGDIKGVMPLDRGNPAYRGFLKDLSRATHPQDGVFAGGAVAVEVLP